MQLHRLWCASEFSRSPFSEEKERLDRIILYIQSEQKRGYWNYSKSKVDVDLLHQCYTCEGILDYGKVTGNNDLLCTAIHGVKFVMNNIPFFETERYLFNIHDNENVLILCKHVILRGYQRFFPENWRFTKTRIWSLAALLRVLVTCWVETRELFYEEYADSLVRHIMKEISDSKKHLLVGNNNLHIRNTYHLLEALSFYLNVKEVGVAADSPR